MENGRFADGKAIHRLMEKDRPFPQDGKPLSHSAARLNAVVTDVIEGVAEADKPNEDEK